MGMPQYVTCTTCGSEECEYYLDEINDWGHYDCPNCKKRIHFSKHYIDENGKEVYI